MVQQQALMSNLKQPEKKQEAPEFYHRAPETYHQAPEKKIPEWGKAEFDDFVGKHRFDAKQTEQLARILARREATFKDDREGLRMAMFIAKNPPAFLAVKMREMK